MSSATLFIYIFVTLVSIFLGIINYDSSITTFTPTIFIVGVGLLIGAVALSNTPLLKGGAIVLWFTWIFLYIWELKMPASVSGYIFALVLVPSIIAMAMELMEVGKG